MYFPGAPSGLALPPLRAALPGRVKRAPSQPLHAALQAHPQLRRPQGHPSPLWASARPR